MISQLRTVANQLTLLRLIFIPFIIISIVGHDYKWALGLFIAAGISDGLDGLLARKLGQQTRLGEYLDPIADKLLLSGLFLVLALVHQIPWKFTVMVFSRDLCILIICAVVFATTTLRNFRPTILGKMTTAVEVATIFFVLLRMVMVAPWVHLARRAGLYATFVLTLVSAIHYVLLLGYRLRAHEAHRATSAG